MGEKPNGIRGVFPLIKRHDRTQNSPQHSLQHKHQSTNMASNQLHSSMFYKGVVN